MKMLMVALSYINLSNNNNNNNNNYRNLILKKFKILSNNNKFNHNNSKNLKVQQEFNNNRN